MPSHSMYRKRVTHVAGYRSIVETSLHSIAMVLFYSMARSGVQFFIKFTLNLHHIIKSRVERAECSKCSTWGKVRIHIWLTQRAALIGWQSYSSEKVLYRVRYLMNCSIKNVRIKNLTHLRDKKREKGSNAGHPEDTGEWTATPLVPFIVWRKGRVGMRAPSKLFHWRVCKGLLKAGISIFNFSLPQVFLVVPFVHTYISHYIVYLVRYCSFGRCCWKTGGSKLVTAGNSWMNYCKQCVL